MLPSPNEAIADPRPYLVGSVLLCDVTRSKWSHSWPSTIFGWQCSPVRCYPNEAVADPRPYLVGSVLLCDVTRSKWSHSWPSTIFGWQCSPVRCYPNEAVADPRPYLVGSVLLCDVTKLLKEAIADPTWLQPTTAANSDYFVVDNMVYMSTVSNSNNTQHVLICV